MSKKNLIVGQSGGPTAVINSSLYGVVSEGLRHPEQIQHIYGMVNGIEGFLAGTVLDFATALPGSNLEKLKTTPGAYLGSCRYKLPESLEDPVYPRLFQKFSEMNIGWFFYIGGNDSMDTVSKLSRYAAQTGSDIRIIGEPKTIDNDLVHTDHTPGFGSAARYVASTVREITIDANVYEKKSVTIVEIMGRNAGWLTAASALARTECNDAPDLIYLPEVVFDKERFLKDIEEKFKEKSSIMIAVSEGIHDENGNFLDSGDSQQYDAFGHPIHFGTGKVLENICKEHFGCKVRSIELNVLQRCAMHIASKVDIDESFFIGKKAVETALADHTNVMMGVKRTSNDPYTAECIYSNVQDIANLEQKVPAEWITKEGNDITQELYDYLYPLIQGEIAITYKNGIPSYIDIAHLKEN